MKKAVIGIVFIVVVTFLIRFIWSLQISPVSSSEDSKIFVVEKGENFSSISKRLKKENLIKSELAFKILGKQTNLDNQIQAGTFRLSPSQASEEILKTLTERPLDTWVTLLEGWRVEEMAGELSEQGTVDSEQFIKQAKRHEGYLFPDTYLFPKDYSVDQIIQKLRDTFDQRYTPEIRAKVKNLGLTEDEGVILASVVEREGRSQEVRRMIASILLKRLKIGMGLNADATIQYALGYQSQEKSWWKRHLTRDDLKIDSPYNTYIHSGLPPTPIANSSLSSLKAVADADPSTPYLYYYHDSKGNSYYSKTLEEHNANVANHP